MKSIHRLHSCLGITLLCLNVISSFGQRPSDPDERKKSNCLETIEWKINKYSDSLNFWSKEMELPKFLSEPKFDQKHFFGNECIKDRNSFSHRKAIFDRVSNIDALEAIVNSKNPLLDSLYILTPEQAAKKKDYLENFSYATYSNRYLAQRRLRRIDEIKRLLEKSKE